MKEFKIKNYTTKVKTETTISEIEKILTLFGATAIMKNYENGKVTSLAFKINEIGYRLPINVEGVNIILTQMTNKADIERAERVAWRVLKDWLHSQLSLILSGQAEPQQVLLPYVYDGKRTLYEAYKEGILQIGGVDE